MKVAFVVDAFPVPSQTFVVTQIAGVVERGHAVDIYSCGAPAVGPAPPHSVSARIRYLDAPAGKIARLRRAAAVLAANGWRAPLLFARALNVFRYRRDALSLRLVCAADAFADGPQAYDVIHCQFGPLGRMAMRLRQIGALRGALITAFRGYDATELLKRDPHLYDELFRRGELFLPVSDALRRILIAHGADPAKTEVHHSGIDCGKFNFQPRVPADGEPLRVVSVARLVEKKGIEFGVRAVARLIQRGRRVAYDIVGDGPLRAPLQRLISDFRMEADIRILGPRHHDDVAALLKRAHVLIAPSVTAANGDQEGIANVLKEAMATGMPVVATVHGGTAELVEDGVSGFLVPERDADALAARLDYLLAHPERWADMGRAGRATVEAEFNEARLNDQLERIYRRLAPDPSTRARVSIARPSYTVDKI